MQAPSADVVAYEALTQPAGRPAAGPAEEATDAQRRIALLVVGMHRSGTSALAGLLARLGIALPGPLMDPAPENPLGFAENRNVAALNDAVLARLGASWDSPVPVPAAALGSPGLAAERDALRQLIDTDYAAPGLFLIKDPRLCLLAPLWTDALTQAGCEVRCVLPARHPREVAASLNARDGLPRDVGLTLWLHHLLHAERHTRGFRRGFTTYGAMLADWRGLARKLERECGLVWPASPMHVAARVDDFLRGELRHHHAPERLPAQGEPLERLCLGAWEAWQALARDAEDRTARSALDAIADELAAALGVLGPALAAVHGALWKPARLEVAALREEAARAAAAAHEARLAAEQEIRSVQAAAQREAARAGAAEAALEALRSQAGALAAEADALREGNAALRAALDELRGVREEWEHAARALEQIRASTSWRVTAPLRALAQRLRRR